MRGKLAGLMVGLSSLAAFAQAPGPAGDPIAGRLEEAKLAYRKAIEEAPAIVRKGFEAADERARDDADVALVEAIKQARAKFEATGLLPDLLYLTEFNEHRDRARKAMLGAYRSAIRDHLKARRDDEARLLADDRDRFERRAFADPEAKPGVAPPVEFGAARFGEGSEWINGIKVVVGDPQFTLIWDSTADLDLHVIEPGGKEIFWNDRKGLQGGELDVDNVEGSGPENIAWPAGGRPTTPAGEYRWFVHYYGGQGGIPERSSWKVRVKHAGKVEVFQGFVTAPGARSKTYSLQVEPSRSR